MSHRNVANMTIFLFCWFKKPIFSKKKKKEKLYKTIDETTEQKINRDANSLVIMYIK